MELSVTIQAKVEVTPSNWNFGFQPTNFFRVSFALLLRRLFLPHFMLVLISERAVHSPFESSFSRKLLGTDSFSEQHASRFDGRPGQGCIWNGGCILIREKCLAGMIFSREIHPVLTETSCRDDFQQGISSCFDGNLRQG